MTRTCSNYVQSFMTTYTTLDPFQANYYGDRIQSQATGDFAKMFKEKINEILVQVARVEPTQGTVDGGRCPALERRRQRRRAGRDQGLEQGRRTERPIESGNRWVVTAKKEGQLWKISQLIQVI